MLVLTAMYDPRVPTLAAVEEERKTLCTEEELTDMREDAQKKRRTYPSRNESRSIQPSRDSLLYFFF